MSVSWGQGPLRPDSGGPESARGGACGPAVGNGLLRVGRTGKPPRIHELDVLGDTLGCLGLGGGIRHRCLVGQLARVDDEKAELGPIETPISVLHWHAADDTVPVPLPGRLLPCPAWLFEQERHHLRLLAPCL